MISKWYHRIFVYHIIFLNITHTVDNFMVINIYKIIKLLELNEIN